MKQWTDEPVQSVEQVAQCRWGLRLLVLYKSATNAYLWRRLEIVSGRAAMAQLRNWSVPRTFGRDYRQRGGIRGTGADRQTEGWHYSRYAVSRLATREESPQPLHRALKELEVNRIRKA